MTLIINLIGSPSAGKSTMASHVFCQLKYKGINCELVNEFAKEKTWENNHTALQDQFYITACQHYKQHILNGKVDVIITDSPIILGLFYYKETNPILYNSYQDFILETFRQQDNMNYWVNRDKPYNPVGRNQSEAEALKMDETIHDFLHKHDISHIKVLGNPDGATEVSHDVLKRLKNEN